MVKFLFLLLGLINVSCATTYYRKDVGKTLESTKSETYGKIVRKDFVFVYDRNRPCDTSFSERTHRRITAPSELKLDAKGNLKLAVGQVDCRDKSQTRLTVVEKDVFFQPYNQLEIEPDANREIDGEVKEVLIDKFEATNPMNLKQPKTAEVEWIVGDEDGDEDIEIAFSKNPQTETFYYGSFPFPKAFMKAVEKELEKERKDRQLVRMILKYKNNTVDYYFSPELFNRKCPSPVQGEPDDERHCPDYSDKIDEGE